MLLCLSHTYESINHTHTHACTHAHVHTHRILYMVGDFKGEFMYYNISHKELDPLAETLLYSAHQKLIEGIFPHFVKGNFYLLILKRYYSQRKECQ